MLQARDLPIHTDRSVELQESRREDWGLTKLALACLLLICSNAVAQESNPVRVLVFSDGGLSTPTMALAVQNIHTVLEEGLANRLEYYSEDLEFPLFPDEASQQSFHDFYARKYRKRQPNIIIAAGDLLPEN